MKCQKCGAANKKGATFCHKCGVKLEVEKKGKPTPSNANTRNYIIIGVLAVFLIIAVVAALSYSGSLNTTKGQLGTLQISMVHYQINIIIHKLQFHSKPLQ